jgi:UDP-GlcNAc:undecaprenyl-phosphate GlcNAc-1-phosphate transferase
MVLAFLATPLAMRVAYRTDFLDRPERYKTHRTPTPYLGGAAVWAAVMVVALPFVAAVGALAVVLICAGGLWIVGTIDDRWPLMPSWRLAAELCAATLLYAQGLHWSLGSGPVDFLLTALWVIGVVNAFNLMDNLDGAAATVAAVSAAGIGTFALVHGEPAIGAVSFALSGACLGFLPHNLARPARIFLGDGGSMTLGFLIAGLVLLTFRHHPLGRVELLAGGLLVGLPSLDTALVVFSRWRRDAPILVGGRDHLTHRLLTRLGSPRRIACALALGQGLLCAAALLGSALGRGALTGLALAAVAAGLGLIAVMETGQWALPQSKRALPRTGVIARESPPPVDLTLSPPRTIAGAPDPLPHAEYETSPGSDDAAARAIRGSQRQVGARPGASGTGLGTGIGSACDV